MSCRRPASTSRVHKAAGTRFLYATHPKTITKGENTTEYQYDSHGRLTGVNDNQKGQVNYAYQKDEEGIRVQLDDRTKGKRSNRTQVTANNQTQAQLQYARMTGSPWQSVIWHESLNKLLVPLPGEINAPDTGYQSAKQRRRLRDAKSIIKSQQLEHDRPSNSQFTPSEYSLVNCSLGDDGEAGGVNQDCYLYGVLLDAASTITIGIPYTFSALAIGGSECDPTYNFVIDGVDMGQSDSGYFTHSFGTPGEHSVQTTAHCRQCVGYYKWDGIGVNVQCPLPVTQTPTRLTTINYIDTVIAPNASVSDEVWGQMGFANGADLLTIDITPYYESSSDSWKARITQASSNYWMWWRLLPPRPTINKPNAVLEATATQATKQNCTKMMTDLKSLGAHDVDWYVLEAVEEHEKEHEKEWKVMLDAAFLVITSEIEALSVPHVCGMTAAQAKTKFKALGEYIKILEDKKFEVADAFLDKLDPSPATNAAEFRKTVPVITNIINKAAADWPQACKQ
ncbi:MAG: hypothetical protein HRT35_09900 [Algicola sp.]|nr:hypothetical protein [Algicola sp.]